MSKLILSEELRFTNEKSANDFLFTHLNPLSEDLIYQARISKVYKQNLSYLNTLPKNLEIEVYISLSGRNFNRTIMQLGEGVKENLQKFFKEMTGDLIYIYEDRIISNPPMFREIQIDNIKVGEIPSLQNELSIFHKIALILPPELPEGWNREGYKPYNIYGNLPLEEAYKHIQNKILVKKAKEDAAQEEHIYSIDREDEISKLPLDKQMEFINLPKAKIDLTGPFLLKWSQQA